MPCTLGHFLPETLEDSLLDIEGGQKVRITLVFAKLFEEPLLVLVPNRHELGEESAFFFFLFGLLMLLDLV